MQTLADLYHPITASPFSTSVSYREIPPCDALKPYIRCFWGSEIPAVVQPSDDVGIVNPDTCMDMIFEIDHMNNKVSGYFCALDDRSYFSNGIEASCMKSTFAIRFYAWAVILFTDSHLRGTKNSVFPVEDFFARFSAALSTQLLYVTCIADRISIAERTLLRCFHPERMDSDLLNVIYYVIKNDGKVRISEACGYASISERQLERVFSHHLGVSPKTFASLLRYQLLWQDMLTSACFNVLDAVEKYGYTDQAHLVKDFRKRHMMSPQEAVRYALKR